MAANNFIFYILRTIYESVLCCIVYLSAVSAGRQAAWQDVQDEIYDRVADKVSAVRSVFKEHCAGVAGLPSRSWQTLAQQKVASVYEMRNLAKSKSIQALACCNVVKFLRCIAVFHTALHSSPTRFPTFSTVWQFSHTKKVQRSHLKPNPKPKRKPRRSTRNRKSEVLHSICEQAANHQSPSPARTASRQQRQRRLQLQLQQRNEKFSFYLN